jgi:predicted nucleotide-binding protein
MDGEKHVNADAAPKQTVFLVHGRDEQARKAVEALLRAFFVKVVPWERAVGWTGGAAPYTGDVVKTGLDRSNAVVVLLTPDDLGHLRPEFLTDRDERHEREPTGQPRMNVIFEAGMAMAINRDSVVLVEVGAVRPMTDIAGVNVIRLDDSVERRRAFGRRLEAAGLTVEWDDDEWRTAGTFNRAGVPVPAAPVALPKADRGSVKRAAYRAFWTLLVDRARTDERALPIRSRSVPADNWLVFSSRNGEDFVLSFASQRRLRCEFYIGRSEATENFVRFHALESYKDLIEQGFGSPLSWEALPGKKASRIATYRDGDVLQTDHHDEYAEWFLDSVTRLRAALEPFL